MLKPTDRPLPRRGFTLIEMIVSMVILSAMGIAFTKYLTMQNRFFERETNAKSARSIARGSMALLLSDLRMVQDSGGVDNVSTDGKTLRVIVPYRFGLYCGTNGLKSTVSMLPADSAVVAMAAYDGYAWRDTTKGRYTLVANSAAPAIGSQPNICTGNGGGQAQLRTVSVNGRAGDILDIPLIIALPAPAPGTPVFFWQKITYSFQPSAIFPGLFALWRTQEGGRNDELFGPFDANARFRFYRTGDDTSVTVVPSLDSIRGVDLVLSANSPRISAGRTNEKAQLVTSVFFKNTRQY
jgi:prepilin-type N-terminal cleavage/methylation domain-containing protein